MTPGLFQLHRRDRSDGRCGILKILGTALGGHDDFLELRRLRLLSIDDARDDEGEDRHARETAIAIQSSRIHMAQLLKLIDFIIERNRDGPDAGRSGYIPD